MFFIARLWTRCTLESGVGLCDAETEVPLAAPVSSSKGMGPTFFRWGPVEVDPVTWVCVEFHLS